MDHPQSAAVTHYNRAVRRRIDLFNRRQARREARGALVDTPFSPETIRQMTGAQFRIVHYLWFLTRIRRREHPGQAPYIQPSQGKIAAFAGISRTWASRSTTQLARLGLVRKQFRRAERGVYKTCLYTLSPNCRWLLGQLLGILSSKNHRVLYTAHKATSAGTSTHIGARFLPLMHAPPG